MQGRVGMWFVGRVTVAVLLVLAATAVTSSRAGETSTGKRPVTFAKDIAPLVFERCAGCHRPGEVAPFSLLSYDDVSKRADQLCDVIGRRVMPPWKPHEGHGQFAGDRRLSAEEIALVRRWVEDGASEGSKADLPPPPSFPEGWQLGAPDLTITLPEPIEVPAAGRDLYPNLVLPLEIPAGKYLKAIEIRPSNRRVVHHAVLTYDTSGRGRERDKADPGPGFHSVNFLGRLLPGSLAIWTPGRMPQPLADGLSMPWPKGADLLLQLHLHPSGKAETEQTLLGVHFTDEPPVRSMLDVALIDTKIDIPPGEKAYRTQDSVTLPIDVEVVSIFPHMHMIGRDIRVTASLPDGSTKPLLWIDDWDFNWQDTYQYATPVALPKGTKITLAAIHDNSADNPQNPRNPPERVRWGEQTFNEMSIAFLNLVPARESDMPELQAHPVHKVHAGIVPEATKALLAKTAPAAEKTKKQDLATRVADTMRKVDRDKNGKLSLDEIVAVVGDRVPKEELERHFGRFDRDGDKQLDLDEVNAVIKAFDPR